MSIKVGEAAPPLSVEAYVGGEDVPVALDTARPGESWTVLFCYPRAFTFVCPTELRSFARLETSPGLTVIDYPVVADVTHELSRGYGVLNAEDGSALRGTFIIDPDGIVRHASVSDPSVGRSPEEALRILKAHRRALPGLVAARPAHTADRGVTARG